MSEDPIARFEAWLAEARAHPGIIEPTAMSLATATEAGRPSVRIVLLKSVDRRGFTFFSNQESKKGRDLALNPNAALCFYWMPMGRQVRIEGRAEQVFKDEADAYFASRPRDSRIGAWASLQSWPLASREALEQAVREATERFEGKEVPRPPYWTGWRVIPERIEFWTERPFRLHDREVYVRADDGRWSMTRLFP